MTTEYVSFVDGRYVQPAPDGWFDLVDPTTGEVSGRSANSSQADVDAAFQVARRAFDSGWGRTTPAERQAALDAFADRVEERADEFVDAEVRDCGKPRGLTRSEEIPQVLDSLRFFAAAARSLEGRAAAEYLADHTSWVRREPVGPVGQITPWNYPMLMASWKIGPALAAGNTVVLKPAETTPGTALLYAEIGAEVLPPGVLNVVVGDRETGRHVASHPAARVVSITGSTRAGIDVARSGASNLARMHLELGGNAPVVVFADADLALAAEKICEAAFFNAGQDCTAASRVLVEEPVRDELTRLLVDTAVQLKPGLPDQDDVFYGPLNNRAQLERLERLLAGLGAHATVELGGKAVDRAGFFFEPTVVANVEQDDEIVQTEVFGPVITVQAFRDEAGATAAANGVEQGLASSVWTRDHARALRMSRDLEFGCVWINAHIPVVGEMPHGGFRMSGYGKDLSIYALDDYTRIKHVMSSLGA